MKKLLIVGLIIMLVSSATVIRAEEYVSVINDFDSGVFDDKDWDSKIGTYDGDIVTDADIAKGIASIVLKKLQNEGMAIGYKEHSVFYDNQDCFWVISYAENEDIWTDGGDLSVAIQKSDAAILRVWFGE